MNTKSITQYCMLAASLLASTLIQAQEFDARLSWSGRLEVGSAVSGVIESVNAHVGDKVKKGDVLIQLDNSVFKAQVKEFKARLKSATEQLKESERERDRAQELYTRTVLSDHELQVAKNNLVASQARLEQVKASLADSQYKLRYSSISVPYDALVLQRNAQPGQVISTDFAQTPLLVVAASNKMLAHFTISEDDFAVVSKGKSVTVEVAGNTYNGKVIAVGLESNSATGSLKSSAAGFPVEVEFESQQQLRAGQSAKVLFK